MRSWYAPAVSLVLVLLLFGTTTVAQNPETSAKTDPPPAHVIDHVQVVDVVAGQIIPNQRVVIVGNRIQAVGSVSTVEIPAGAMVVDGTDKFLIPGLFDAHVHLVSDADTFAPLLVAHGVTSVRDLGGPTDMILALKRSAADRQELSPDITATGAIVDGKPPIWPFSEAVETAEEAIVAVRKLADAGVDQIKVYSLLKRDVYLAAVAEAKRLGLPVTGHVPYSVTLSEAAEAGQNAIEHLEGFAPLFNQMTQAPDVAGSSTVKAFQGWSHWAKVDPAALKIVLDQQREKGIVHVPTLIVMASIGRITDEQDDPRKDPRMKYVSPTMLNFWQTRQYDAFSPRARAAVPAMTELVAELYRQGVPLAIGTDLANPYVFAGSSVHDEMERFAAAKIPAAEILKMATINAAKLCGVADQRGLIQPGMTASLVLLTKNPLEDIRAVRQIESVWLRGKYLDRQSLDQVLADVEAFAQGTTTGTDPTTPPTLPGTVVLQGKYVLKFQQFDAGTETFIVTKSDDGFRTWSHSNPKGGGQVPAIVQTHYSAAGLLQSAQYRTLGKSPLDATYRLSDGKLAGTAKTEGKPDQDAEHPLAANYRISTPIYATEFMFYRDLGLKIGESTKLQSIGFGYPTWKPDSVEVEIRRGEDETLELDGKTWSTQVYLSKLKSAMGEMNVKTWSDSDGHTVKSELKFPFGSVTATRVLEERKVD